MWRSAVAQCIEQEAELAECFIAANAEQAEDLELKFRVMNPNRAAAHLLPIKHHVIGQCANRKWIAFERCQIVWMWRSKRMVNRDQPLFLFTVFEQWKIQHP